MPLLGDPGGAPRPAGLAWVAVYVPFRELVPLTVTDVPRRRPFRLRWVAFVGLHLVAAFMRVSCSCVPKSPRGDMWWR